MKSIQPVKMKKLEDNTEKIGISKLLLMENAGAGLAKIIINRYNKKKIKKILIICGSGNNGGDGLVCARHLLNFADTITICLLNTKKTLKTHETKTNWKIINNINQIKTIEFFQNDNFFKSFDKELSKCNIVIDAIFGTGIKGNMKEHFTQVIKQVNKKKKHIISVDIPSGLDPATGDIHTNVIKAEVTVTFHKVKKGLQKKKNITGKIIVIPIGIPPELEKDL